MSHKKIIGILIAICAVIYVLSEIWLKSNAFSFGLPLAISMPIITIVLGVLLFFSSSVFKLWSKFAIVFIIISILAEAFAPNYCHGFFDICINKYLLTWFLSIIFLLISLAIIIYKKVKEGGK